MHLFDWLLIAHLFGDYVSQTTSEAKGKDKGGILNKYLLLHCLKYTLVCGFVLFLYHISLYWLVLIFTSHMVLDYRKFLIWFRRSIKRESMEAIEKTGWITIVLDQTFHLLILAVVSILN
jgi:hypothetical protein